MSWAKTLNFKELRELLNNFWGLTFARNEAAAENFFSLGEKKFSWASPLRFLIDTFCLRSY